MNMFFLSTMSAKIHSLKLTVRTYQEAILQGRRRKSSNHPFSGAFVVNFREDTQETNHHITFPCPQNLSEDRPALRVGVSTQRFEHPVYPRPSSNGPLAELKKKGWMPMTSGMHGIPFKKSGDL